VTRINLLDWRQEQREKNKRQFLILIAIAVIAALAALGVAYWILNEAIDGQNARNQLLNKELSEANKKIKEIQELEKTKADLLARMRVIEELQAGRTATVHFFDEIVKTLPDGVYLKSVKQDSSGHVSIEGVAESNGRVSAYLKSLDASDWFADPDLVVIKSAATGSLKQREFTIKVKSLKLPKSAKAAEAKKNG